MHQVLQLSNEEGDMHIIQHLVHQICLVIPILSLLLFIQYSLSKFQFLYLLVIHVIAIFVVLTLIGFEQFSPVSHQH